MYYLDKKSNPPVYFRYTDIEMERSTLHFEAEILSSEFDVGEREAAARKHAELRLIDEIIAGLEEYKRKYYNYE